MPQFVATSLSSVYCFPMLLSFTHVARNILDRNRALKDAIATQHAQLAIMQRAVDENGRALTRTIEQMDKLVSMLGSGEGMSFGMNPAMAALATFVDPNAAPPEHPAPSRVYSGQFIVLAFDYYMTVVQDIATQMGRIVGTPDQAHPDEVEFLLVNWPPISVSPSENDRGVLSMLTP